MWNRNRDLSKLWAGKMGFSCIPPPVRLLLTETIKSTKMHMVSVILNVIKEILVNHAPVVYSLSNIKKKINQFVRLLFSICFFFNFCLSYSFYNFDHYAF